MWLIGNEAVANADEGDAPPDCCYDSCTCCSCGYGDEEFVVPPGEDAPRMRMMGASEAALDGVRLADDTSDECEMSPAVTDAFVPLGVGISAVDLFADQGQVCRDTASVDGQFVADLIGEPGSTGGVDIPNLQGVTATMDLTGAGSSGDPIRGGDPIDPVTGEYIIKEVDLALPSFGVGVALVRTYRSRVDYLGPMGPGWDHTYNQRLVTLPVVDASGVANSITYPALPIANLTVPEIGAGDGTPEINCGPSVALTTGEATTIRFTDAT